MNRRSSALVGVAALVVLAGGVVMLFSSVSPASADELALEIVEECSEEANYERCYENTVPLLYGEYTLPEIFGVLRSVRRMDERYQFCHVLAHKLGELAVAEDPSEWLDAIPLNPADGLCSNGFIHGVIVGRFRDEVLDDERLKAAIPDFARACEPRPDWQPTPLDQAICYHGMGHLFMFITNASYERSLHACDAITLSPTGNFERVCREGVFMQTYQPLEPDDFALIELLPEEPTRENYRRICARFDDADEGACLREAWPFFRNEILDGSGIAKFCSGQPTAIEEDACYDSVFAILGRSSLSEPASAAGACSLAPSAERAKCFGIVAAAYVEEDRTDAASAIDFCMLAEGELRDSCLITLAQRARFMLGSEGARAFCAQLPAEVRSHCRV